MMMMMMIILTMKIFPQPFYRYRIIRLGLCLTKKQSWLFFKVTEERRIKKIQHTIMKLVYFKITINDTLMEQYLLVHFLEEKLVSCVSNALMAGLQ